jgi:hypothetical protein
MKSAQEIIEKRLTCDAPGIIALDGGLAQSPVGEMSGMPPLAEVGRMVQGLVAAHQG